MSTPAQTSPSAAEILRIVANALLTARPAASLLKQAGELEAEQPEPRWRDLLPGELVQAGDQCKYRIEGSEWTILGQIPAVCHQMNELYTYRTQRPAEAPMKQERKPKSEEAWIHEHANGERLRELLRQAMAFAKTMPNEQEQGDEQWVRENLPKTINTLSWDRQMMDVMRSAIAYGRGRKP